MYTGWKEPGVFETGSTRHVWGWESGQGARHLTSTFDPVVKEQWTNEHRTFLYDG